MRVFANILTLIFHPLLLLIPAVLLIVYQTSNSILYTVFWTTVTMLFAGIVAIFVILGVKRGFFSDIDISKRVERFVLFAFTLLVTALFLILLLLLNGPTSLFIAAIYLIIVLLVFDLINTFIKASIHVAAISAMTVGLSIIYGGVFVFLLILIPLVSWARIIEKRHTVREVIVGVLIGSLLTLVVLLVVQYILAYV